MAKSISGEGYKINIGMHIDTEDGAKQINNFIKNAERVGKPIKTTIEIDGKKFEQTIEQWENKLNHQTIKLEYLNQFQNGWKSAKTTVSASVTQIKDEVETLNLAMKEKHQQDIQAEKDAEKLARALEKEAEQAQKLAEKEALRQAKTAEKLKEKEAKEREKAEKSLIKTLEKKAIAEKKASEQAQKHAEKEKQLAEQAKRSNSIFSNFIDTFMKMVKFNTINLVYDGLIDSMRQAIEVTKDFDKAMTEFKKVTDTSKLSLSDYLDELTELGATVARTTTEMVSATTEFSKSGFTPEESARLAQISSLYQNIADAELSAGESASYVISQMKAFGYTVDEAMQIIDKTNEVKLFVTS